MRKRWSDESCWWELEHCKWQSGGWVQHQTGRNVGRVSWCGWAALSVSAAAVVLVIFGSLGAAAALRRLLFIPSQQSFDFGRDLPLIHGRAPLFVHLQLLPQGADGSLFAGHQLLQVLVSELLPGSTLSGTLTASLKFGLQVNLGRLAATFSRFLHFSRHHLVFIHLAPR